jgi:hypothetical protein
MLIQSVQQREIERDRGGTRVYLRALGWRLTSTCPPWRCSAGARVGRAEGVRARGDLVHGLGVEAEGAEGGRRWSFPSLPRTT